MKNATESQVNLINATGCVPAQLMFMTPIGKAHVVYLDYIDCDLPRKTFFAESANGKYHGFIHISDLKAIPKKQGTPPKPKKPHVKGTRPELGYQ